MKSFFIVLLFLSVLIPANSVEIVSSEIEAFGFTSDGYYCKALIGYRWEYSGENIDFFKRTKQNTDGYISTRIQLLYFDSIGNSKGSIINSRQSNEDSHPFDLSIQEDYIVSALNKEIQEVEAFEGVFLANLDIIISELFQTTFVPK